MKNLKFIFLAVSCITVSLQSCRELEDTIDVPENELAAEKSYTGKGSKVLPMDSLQTASTVDTIKIKFPK